MIVSDDADEEWRVRADELQKKITDQYDPDDFTDKNEPKKNEN